MSRKRGIQLVTQTDDNYIGRSRRAVTASLMPSNVSVSKYVNYLIVA